jgi:phosphoribosyl 1,2-cyclic phosphodiesterase
MVTNICVLASGSSGNVTAVWNEQGCLLIDFGASCAFVETSLRSIGCAPEQCNGIVFTHAHSDHIGAGALLFARRYRVPLYLHQETLPCVEERWDVARVRQCDPSLVVPHFDFPFTVGPFELIPFPASHSGGAVGRPLGFASASGRERKSVASVF